MVAELTSLKALTALDVRLVSAGVFMGGGSWRVDERAWKGDRGREVGGEREREKGEKEGMTSRLF